MVRGNNNREVVAFSEDLSSPFYLHPSDNHGTQLVTQQLNGSNYNSWNRSMITALLAKNKFAFVDGSLPKPDQHDQLHPIWLRCNSMVVSWLRNSVSAQISSSLMYLDNVSAIWFDLKERFSQGNLARIYQLRQQLMNLSQDQLDGSSYFTNLRIIWDEYKDFQPISWCSCGGCRCDSARKWSHYQEQKCTMQFLIGLNSSYSQLHSQILSVMSLASLSNVFGLVMQEERQRNIHTNPSFVQTLSEQPTAIANAASGPNRSRDRFLCTHCGKTNHTVDRCYQLHGFPPGFGRGRGKSSSNADKNSSDTM